MMKNNSYRQSSGTLVIEKEKDLEKNKQQINYMVLRLKKKFNLTSCVEELFKELKEKMENWLSNNYEEFIEKC